LIDPKVLKLSDKGLEFVKDYEQPELKLYDAVPGKGDWTIGWGHKCTPEEVKKYKNSITIEQAEELLIKDLNEKIIPTSLQPFLVENNIKLTQNQYDALVSFTVMIPISATIKLIEKYLKNY
jgi:GH24 family phage-related lysozyme (muramidase)